MSWEIRHYINATEVRRHTGGDFVSRHGDMTAIIWKGSITSEVERWRHNNGEIAICIWEQTLSHMIGQYFKQFAKANAVGMLFEEAEEP